MKMNNEILLLKARLADINSKLKETEHKSDAYISVIREIIDPYAGDSADFDMDKFMVIARDFYTLWEETKKLRADKARLEAALYG